MPSCDLLVSVTPDFENPGYSTVKFTVATSGIPGKSVILVIEVDDGFVFVGTLPVTNGQILNGEGQPYWENTEYEDVAGSYPVIAKVFDPHVRDFNGTKGLYATGTATFVLP